MKKIITFIAAICLVFGVAGNATAAFDYGTESSLILSITDKNSTETGYDLGTMDVDFSITDQQVMLAEAGTVDFNAGYFVGVYAATSDWEFTYGINPNYTSETPTSNYIALQNAYISISEFGYGHDNGTKVEISPSSIRSYSTLLSGGDYLGFVPNAVSDMEVTLNPLDGNAYVDVALYQYLAMTGELKEGLIRIYENGAVELNPVPVPAAVWLLGSGLLGLVGIRRKRA